MPHEIYEVIGEPFVGQRGPMDAFPVIVKALDVTDVCPMKYGGRTIIVYARAACGDRHVAFIASAPRDPLDGVCTATTIEKLTGDHRRAHRQQLYAFARPLGINPGTLVELALIHQPPSAG